jgi:hypothetical protein
MPKSHLLAVQRLAMGTRKYNEVRMICANMMEITDVALAEVNNNRLKITFEMIW